MKTKPLKYSYVEWLSAEEMHETSKQFLSELNFIKDEQLFLNDLVKSFTLQLIDTDIFEESKKVIDQIQRFEKDMETLLKKVRAHENQLQIMVDDIDQLTMEKAYIVTHKELLNDVNEYVVKYRKVKERLFKVVSSVMKREKQKRLLK